VEEVSALVMLTVVRRIQFVRQAAGLGKDLYTQGIGVARLESVAQIVYFVFSLF
jgi:hypothetical protein